MTQDFDENVSFELNGVGRNSLVHEYYKALVTKGHSKPVSLRMAIDHFVNLKSDSLDEIALGIIKRAAFRAVGSIDE